MQTNTLVKHKHLKSLGIGVVSRTLKSSIEVTFGENDIRKLKPEELRQIDASKIKTVSFADVKNRMSKDKYYIHKNVLAQLVGISWIFIRNISEEDLEQFKVVI